MTGTKSQQTAYAYGAVESGLAEVLGIEPHALKAFKGRVRHLRNLGYPTGLPRPGSGRKIEYSFDQIMEMLFALFLQHTGYTPRIAIGLGPGILRLFKLIRDGLAPKTALAASDAELETYLREGADIYIAIKGKRGGPAGDFPTLEDMTFSFWIGYDRLEQGLRGMLDDGAIIINASGLVQKMKDALAKTA
jgi:hypothetical protein